MSGNFAIKGGGVGPLMTNAILNFHFDYLNPSLTTGEANPPDDDSNDHAGEEEGAGMMAEIK